MSLVAKETKPFIDKWGKIMIYLMIVQKLYSTTNRRAADKKTENYVCTASTFCTNTTDKDTSTLIEFYISNNLNLVH